MSKEVDNPLPELNQTMKYKEEGVIDIGADIFEPLFSYNHIYQITKVDFERFSNLHDYYHMWESNLSQAIVLQTFRFPKL